MVGTDVAKKGKRGSRPKGGQCDHGLVNSAAMEGIGSTATVTAANEAEASNKEEKTKKKKRKREKPLDRNDEGAAGAHSGASRAAVKSTPSDNVGSSSSGHRESATVAVDEATIHTRGEEVKRRRKLGPPVRPVAVAPRDLGAGSPPALTCTSKVAEYLSSSGSKASGVARSAADSNNSNGGEQTSPRGKNNKNKNKQQQQKKKEEQKKQSRQSPCHEVASTDSSSRANGSNSSTSSRGTSSSKNSNSKGQCSEDHAPRGEETVADDDNNNDHDHDDDTPFEGVVHDGTMYLVDARRRVFSAERDERGALVEVGTFDDDRGEVIVTGTASSPTNGKASGAGSATASTSAEGLSMSSSNGDAALDVASAQSKAAAEGNGTKKKKKKKKRKKKKDGTSEGGGEGGVGGEGEAGGCVAEGSEAAGRGAADVVEYPFEVEECDHCETSERAYGDIVPLLTALSAELGKAPAELVIYDPYYCQGSMVGRLASLGFPRVHNRKEDFYKVVENGKVPEHDVVVTNPPFSGEHVSKILSFCARQGAKPWFLLLPNYVYLKDYYEPSLSRVSGRGATLPFFLTPPKRYMYYSPQGSRLKVKSSERKTSPFNTFWYVRLGDGGITSKILQSYDSVSRKLEGDARCCVARTTQQIPYKMMDSNDPRRKKARDRQRSIDRIRKKKSEWTTS